MNAVLFKRHLVREMLRGMNMHKITTMIAVLLLLASMRTLYHWISTYPAPPDMTTELWVTAKAREIPYREYRPSTPTVVVSLDQFKRKVTDRSCKLLLPETIAEATRTKEMLVFDNWSNLSRVLYAFTDEDGSTYLASHQHGFSNVQGYDLHVIYNPHNASFTLSAPQRTYFWLILAIVLALACALLLRIVYEQRFDSWETQN